MVTILIDLGGAPGPLVAVNGGAGVDGGVHVVEGEDTAGSISWAVYRHAA